MPIREYIRAENITALETEMTETENTDVVYVERFSDATVVVEMRTYRGDWTVSLRVVGPEDEVLFTAEVDSTDINGCHSDNPYFFVSDEEWSEWVGNIFESPSAYAADPAWTLTGEINDDWFF